MHTVYLAGPISGLGYEGATQWRDLAAQMLSASGIKPLSPLRFKPYLKGIENIDKHNAEYGKINVLSSPRGIMARDRFDATRCDVMLVNLLNAEKVSMGTVMEIAWADLKRIPVVCIMEPGNVHEHSMVLEAIDFRCGSLAEGIELVRAVLG